jgi:hypothetical protein
MKRQQRRRIKREWDKIPCFSDFTVIIDIEGLPNTAVDVFVKVSEDLMLQYNLDMFQRWRLYPIVWLLDFPLEICFMLSVWLLTSGWKIISMMNVLKV